MCSRLQKTSSMWRWRSPSRAISTVLFSGRRVLASKLSAWSPGMRNFRSCSWAFAGDRPSSMRTESRRRAVGSEGLFGRVNESSLNASIRRSTRHALTSRHRRQQHQGMGMHRVRHLRRVAALPTPDVVRLKPSPLRQGRAAPDGDAGLPGKR